MAGAPWAAERAKTIVNWSSLGAGLTYTQGCWIRYAGVACEIHVRLDYLMVSSGLQIYDQLWSSPPSRGHSGDLKPPLPSPLPWAVISARHLDQELTAPGLRMRLAAGA